MKISNFTIFLRCFLVVYDFRLSEREDENEISGLNNDNFRRVVLSWVIAMKFVEAQK